MVFQKVLLPMHSQKQVLEGEEGLEVGAHGLLGWGFIILQSGGSHDFPWLQRFKVLGKGQHTKQAGASTCTCGVG